MYYKNSLPGGLSRRDPPTSPQGWVWADMLPDPLDR